jgi:hypothetical protein
VQILSGFVHSFVYVDYGIKIKALEAELAQGFAGYNLVGIRSLSRADLEPAGWVRRFWPTPDELGTRVGPEMDPSAAYALWTVFERNADRDDDWGAERFSLLFLYADGAAAYEPLFRARQLAPSMVCMIQPGTGFGGNWTDFYCPTAFFHRVVMSAPGPYPAYIMTGGPGPPSKESPWPEFDRLVGEETERGKARMWGLKGYGDAV